MSLAELYLIEILHQTTTSPLWYICSTWLYLIEILHQTTTVCFALLTARTLYLIEILHQTTTVFRVISTDMSLYLIEILHQTTTLQMLNNYSQKLYLIEILHQTTTMRWILTAVSCCILLKFYIKPQPRFDCLLACLGCILLKFYIKPQRRVYYLFDFSALCRFVRPGNRMQNLRRSEFDALFCISKNKDTVFSEKFQLLRHVRFCPFALAPEVENVSILFVCHRQNTRKSSRRHRPSNAIDVNLHVLFRGTMPDIHRILHHCEAVLFQRFAELCRMTPFCFGIGRQIEKDKQPHDPIGIQSRF